MTNARRQQRQQEDDKKGNLALSPGQPVRLYGPPTDELLTLASATLPLAGANFRHGQGWAKWLSGLNLGLQSCIETSPSASQRAQSRRRGDPPSEKNRNEVKEQLVIMLLPMPLCRPSPVGQWRGAYSHDTNRRFKIISIAQIGGSKLLASRAPENEAVRDRRPHEGARRIRGPLQPRAVPRRLEGLPAISPCRQTPIQWQSPMHDEAHGDAFGWGSTVPTAR